MPATPSVLRFPEVSRRKSRLKSEDPFVDSPLARKLVTVRDSRSTFPRIVPLGLIREIDRELRGGGYDRKILTTACRGLECGSSRFEQAYIAARVQDYSRKADTPTDPLPLNPPILITVMPEIQNVSQNPADDSQAILHGGHLMEHFGVWIVCLLTLQALSAWKIGEFAGQTLMGSGALHAAAWLVLLLTFNLRVWVLYYGRESKAFHTPGICLFLLSILPVFLLHQWAALKPLG